MKPHEFSQKKRLALTGLILAGILLSLCQPPLKPIRAEQSYSSITGPCHFQFPRDHASHPGYRTEWWYYTGNLESETGRRFGFQLTFFRRQISPSEIKQKWPQSPSAWRTNQIFLAHAALSDIDGKRFFHDEQMSRGALGMAGVRQMGDRIDVYLKDWSATIDAKTHRLIADTQHFDLDLSLESRKPPVAHGDSGYSLKGRAPQSASCYYSMTRLAAVGFLRVKGRQFKVKGLAWMDHEFSSAPLEADLVGWDWFSLQLDNRTELMIYMLRQKDGGYAPASSATFVDHGGKVSHLAEGSFTIQVLDRWKSPHTQAVYPAGWRIQAPSLSLDLTVVPRLADQEMQTPETTSVTYWEGSVSTKGKTAGQQAKGNGYVELTGYAEDFDAPM